MTLTARVFGATGLDASEDDGHVLPARRVEAPARGLRVFDDAEFCAQPDPAWDIPGVVQQGALEVGFGPSDVGKSTLYAARACCEATGTTWLGLDVVRRGPVVALVFEGRGAFRKKIRGWKAAHGFSAAEPIGVYVIETPVNFLIRTEVDRVTRELERLGAVELLVDTLAQSIGADEENAKMQLAVTHAELVRRRTGARVVFIHHSGKDRTRGARGGSALTAAADTVLALDHARDGHVLRCVRQRDAERFAPMHLKLMKTPDGATVLFDRRDGLATAPLATQLREDIVTWLQAHPGAVTDAIGRGIEKRKADVMTALDALLNAGQITATKTGRATTWRVTEP